MDYIIDYSRLRKNGTVLCYNGRTTFFEEEGEGERVGEGGGGGGCKMKNPEKKNVCKAKNPKLIVCKKVKLQTTTKKKLFVLEIFSSLLQKIMVRP